MVDVADVGTCRICGQGLLIIARNSNGQLFVACEECLSEWESPEQSTSVDAARQDAHGQYQFLGRAELANHPWQQFLSK